MQFKEYNKYVTSYNIGWNVGAQQQQQVCTSTTLSAIFFSFYTVSHYMYLCLKKSLNDEERGGNCLLVPERSYTGLSGDAVSHKRTAFQVVGLY